MFKISLHDIEIILNDYGISAKPDSFIELERENYEIDSFIEHEEKNYEINSFIEHEEKNYEINSFIEHEEKNYEINSKKVRLIVKVKLMDGFCVVIRFKNEPDVCLDLIEKQSQFAVLLKENGIDTPTLYKNKSKYAKWYFINGYKVIVTVEEFVNGELCCIDVDDAEKAGKLLAKMHNISEANNFHIKNEVLFDPFKENELFAVLDFLAHAEELVKINSSLYQSIVEKYKKYMEILAPIREKPRYAVQGDISDCNLYRTNDFIGIFDFNQCGDNNLYCDAVMQAVFVARLMDYPKSYAKTHEQVMLPAFLKGYACERPFSDIQKSMFPYLYAIISAFWSADIKWNEDSLLNELKKCNTEAVYRWLEEIYKRLICLNLMPL